MAEILISAAINLAIGIALTLLFPPPGAPDVTQEGPRLNDLEVTSSAYGTSIPISYGTLRSGGTIIWSSGIEEVATTTRQTTGGKGGMFGGGGGSVTTTTYEYFASFALSLGAGPAGDVLRIWADGNLIFDKTGTGGVGGLNFHFYPGDEIQEADPLIVADVGVGGAPAHRGLCYVVFERLDLGRFGNRIPNITCEVTYNAQLAAPFQFITDIDTADIAGGAAGSGGHLIIDPFSDAVYTLKMGGSGITRSSLAAGAMQAVGGDIGVSFAQLHVTVASNGYIYYQPGSANGEQIVKLDPLTFEVLGTTIEDGAGFGRAQMGAIEVGFPEYGLPPATLLISGGDYTQGTVGTDGPRFWQDDNGTFTLIGGEDDYDSLDIGDAGPVLEDPWNQEAWVTQESAAVIKIHKVSVSVTYDPLFGGGTKIGGVSLTEVATVTKGGTDLPGTANIDGWCMLPDESAVILSNGTGMCKVDLTDGTILASNLTLGFRSTHNWSTGGKFAFPDQAGAGASGPGVIYVINTDDLTEQEQVDLGDFAFGDSAGEAVYSRAAYDPRTHSIVISRSNGSPSPDNDKFLAQVYLQRANGQGVALQGVVEDLFDRAGLASTEYDTSGLSAETVRGFSVTRQSTVRNALQPLQQAFLFEGVESDWLIKTVRRGGASVLTLDADFVGRLGDNNTEPLEETRVQEVELPERIAVRYRDQEHDQQQGLQQSKRLRAPTAAVQTGEQSTLDLPIVFVGNEAKQLADRWLYTAWAERVNWSGGLPWRYIRLDPADVITLPDNGDLRRLRLSETDVGADLSIDFRATQEDSDSDTSAAVADSGKAIQQQVLSTFPTKLHLMDLPLLGAGDASYQAFSRGYFAASGYDDAWPGCRVYRSQDSGATYDEIGVDAVEAAWGAIDGTLPDAITTTTWDDTTVLTLKVFRGIDRFQSSTDLEVLNGDNAIAVFGANGPEIIQFVNVTVIDDGTVEISRLLRGRRGTEPNAISRSVSERFVLLESGRVTGIQIPLDLLDDILQYRAVTVGTQLEDAGAVFHRFTGEDLTPYSPVEVAAVTNVGDVDITWVRRTRFNGELKDGTGVVPLNEQSEAYEVDLLNPADDSLIRTLSGLTSETATYTSAQQTTDGSPASVKVRVYQVSGVVGRGRSSEPLTHTI